MQKADSITPFQLILLAMTAIGLKNHVFAISPLIQTAGRDAWIAVLITMILAFLWIPLFLYVQKKTNRQPLLQWLRATIGDKATIVLAFVLIGYLIVMAAVTLRETITWANVMFLPETPAFFLVILFIFVCWVMGTTNLRTLSILNIFLLFFIIIFGFFVAIANIQYKNYFLLLPILEHGYAPIMKSLIFQASGVAEIFIFLLLQHKLDASLRVRHYAAMIIILTVLTTGPLIGAIVEFGPIEAAKQRFPAYEEWGLVSLGSFIEHLDFLSIYQWMSGAFIRISLILILMKELLLIKTERKKNITLTFLSLGIAGLVLIPITDFTFSKWLTTIFLPASFWFFSAAIILFVILAIFYGRKKRGSTNENKKDPIKES
ncbi:GerAB/ArcD/ProY family transporter [Pseudobacillus wudalianchiensis]|uniref:Spore gernimation protein XB n=1 Tax=Pseudobacillus wudalianchiensis TaxID=1743143 RepID=A0A1B9ATK8_9BACI|nr:endospore germination permease [Bacillus wudalianchiensis]OCA87119.1 spore gernimation protein XB [Bacillus wudalianchiensis]